MQQVLTVGRSSGFTLAGSVCNSEYFCLAWKWFSAEINVVVLPLGVKCWNEVIVSFILKDTKQRLRWSWAMKSCVSTAIALPAVAPPAVEMTARLCACFLPPARLTRSKPCWRPHRDDGLTWNWCWESCRGEQGSSWVAAQCAGPPWLAPVILPSHSSAADINNNSTSGFTLLSRVNPFCSSADCCYSCWWDLNPRAHTSPSSSRPIPPAVSLYLCLNQSSSVSL